MTYRIDDLIVPGDDPFKNDALDRKPLVTNLAGLIGNLNGPFVMVLDAPWGSGKTTLVRMLKAHLESEDFQCIYFNAWEVDYASDPLIAMVSAIDRMDFSASPEAAKTFKNCMKAVKKAAPGFLKRIVVAGTKVVTMGVLDLGAATSERIIADATGETVDSIVDLFARESDQLKTFREELTKAVEQLPEAQKKPNLVFFIDELDRCRPTFAIELLERVKHLFNIPNIVFVLSIDKQQLEASTKAVYGAESNAPEYLRRFFDMEYSIPAIPDERYTANLLARFGLDPVFAERTGAGFQRDSNIFIEFFTQLANAMALSLRARERCITRLRIVMDQTPCNHYLYPLLVALLIVLRSNNDALFRDVVSGKASGPEAVDFLASLSGGQELLSRGKQGVLIQAYFLAMISEPCDDHDLKERARWEEWAKNRGEEVGTVLDLERQIKIDRLGIPIPLPALAAKIDFVAQIR